MASILESLMSSLGPNVVDPLASRLGESSDTVQRGLQSGAAAMLGGVAAKADQPGFMQQIFSLLSNPATTSTSLSSVASSVSSGAPGGASSTVVDLGNRFLSSIFGSNTSAVSDAISKVSGMAASKAGSLLSMAAPLVLAFLGQHIRDNGLSADDLAGKLKAEAPSLQRFLPAGFASLLGGASAAAGHVAGGVTNAAERVEGAGKAAVGSATTMAGGTAAAAANTGKRWIWPLIIIAAIIVFLIWFFNRGHAPSPETANPIAPVTSPATTGNEAGGNTTLKLPDGTQLNVPENGIENQLVTFIKSDKPVDRTTWFNFDRLVFDTGKSTLQASSQEQLNNVAAILRAYPNVHVKVGGYTDNSGNAAANKKLSADRAKNVMDALVAAGIDKGRLESEGYGDQHPVASNDTPEGKAQNRRIALRVTQK